MIIYQSSARYNCKAADKFNFLFLSFSKILWSVPGKDIRSMSTLVSPACQPQLLTLFSIAARCWSVRESEREREREGNNCIAYISEGILLVLLQKSRRLQTLTQEQEQEQRTVRAEAYKLPIL